MLKKWQFWAVVGIFVVDVVAAVVPLGAVVLLLALLSRRLRWWLVDLLLALESDEGRAWLEARVVPDLPPPVD